MHYTISAKFGILEDRIIHLATDDEIQMIKNLVLDIAKLRNESKNSYHLGLATAFLGAAFSSFLTLLALSGNSSNYNLIVALIFATLSVGLFYLWNWRTNKKQESSAIQDKEKQLQDLFDKIESRVEKESDFEDKKYGEIISGQ